MRKKIKKIVALIIIIVSANNVYQVFASSTQVGAGIKFYGNEYREEKREHGYINGSNYTYSNELTESKLDNKEENIIKKIEDQKVNQTENQTANQTENQKLNPIENPKIIINDKIMDGDPNNKEQELIKESVNSISILENSNLDKIPILPKTGNELLLPLSIITIGVGFILMAFKIKQANKKDKQFIFPN